MQGIDDLQTAIQARMGRHSLCRGRQAPVMLKRKLRPGGPTQQCLESESLSALRAFFSWFWIIPGPHGPGKGYVGLPALSRILTLIITRLFLAINP